MFQSKQQKKPTKTVVTTYITQTKQQNTQQLAATQVTTDVRPTNLSWVIHNAGYAVIGVMHQRHSMHTKKLHVLCDNSCQNTPIYAENTPECFLLVCDCGVILASRVSDVIACFLSLLFCTQGRASLKNKQASNKTRLTFQKAPQSWHEQGCPLFDVVHPAFPLPTRASPTLRGWFCRGCRGVLHVRTMQVSVSRQLPEEVPVNPKGS